MNSEAFLSLNVFYTFEPSCGYEALELSSTSVAAAMHCSRQCNSVQYNTVPCCTVHNAILQ